MSFHRSVILSLVTLCTALTLSNLPVMAQEGELAAQDAKSQVNLRSVANTQAEVVATGKVGDRVQILSTVTQKDGQTWYRVKVLPSGTVGWVRGDLIKVLGASKVTTPQKPTVKATLKGVKKSASASLKPPKTVTKAMPAKSAVVQSKPVAIPTPASDSAIATPSVVILAFKTPNYAVRVFSEAGQLRMNLYNRKSKQVVLEAVPVESKNSGKTTTYSYSSDLKVTVVVPAKGTPTLTTVALGNTLQEEPETTSAAPGVTDTAPTKNP
jgi:Bacterial SH3 domain